MPILEQPRSPSGLVDRRRFLQAWALGGAGVLSRGATRPVSAAPAPAPARPARRSAERRLSFALSERHLPAVAPLLAEYTTLTGVIIDPAAFPHADLYAALNADLALGACGYDVVSIDDPWLPLYAGAGFLADLGASSPDAEPGLEGADFVPAFLALGQGAAADRLQALPWIGNVQLFAWRRDVFAELGRDRPRTWDDVIAAASAVADFAQTPELFGFGLRGAPGNAAATTFLPILRGHGGDVFDAAWEPQLESDSAQAAMATLLTLVQLGPPGVAAVGHAALGQALADGRIAQAADIWPNQVLPAVDPAHADVLRQIAIGGQPAQPGVAPGNVTGAWFLGRPAECGEQAQEAQAFILWLTAPAQQRRLMLEGGLPATRLSVLQDEAAVTQIPVLPGLVEAALQAQPRPRTLHYPAVEEILGRWVAQAIAGQVEGEAALGEANAEIRALLVREEVLAA